MANVFRSNPQLFKQFNEYITNNNDNFIKSTTNPKYMKGVSKGKYLEEYSIKIMKIKLLLLIVTYLA